MSEELKRAIDLLCRELKADPAYHYAWQANIAMAVYDECHRRGIEHTRLHQACNDGAIYFLNMLYMDRVTIDENPLKTVLEKAWHTQSPSCGSCGWSNAFYEIEDTLEPTGKPGEYRAQCVSKDDENSASHRGSYVYLDDVT